VQVVIEPFEGPTLQFVVDVEDELVIGRGPEVGVWLDGRMVSRRHALVRATADGLEIEDVSANGTLVDGAYVQMGRRWVGHQCKLVVGCSRLRLHKYH
jgi:pSer/pThr/pTyr-binding forkhead associated (FHA) protein